ncbi:glycosyltransferase family 2 protein [Sphingomonas sp. GB1N7]|uniref:glycosyltransferase family 2 protein n=1 Tax=Parasphingomonas caseinilytica TaxID=3096158 RepID=UPI002FC6486C
MLLDLDARQDSRFAQMVARDRVVRPAWSVLVPFFNEQAFLARTIESLGAQSRAARIILIDNGSTDDSAGIARATCDRLGLDYLLITEARPGKVQALKAGLRWVRTQYVATCDADTFYPAGYLAAAEALLEQDGCVVAGAYFVSEHANTETRLKAGAKMCATARMLPRQCHTGGAGQAFRADVLRRAGGFDADLWGYVLEDHEVIHRMMKQGTMRYSEDLWCAPSPRERDRASIRWTLVERLMYSALAPWAGDWFFYDFLASRLRSRRLISQSIRERQFQGAAYAGQDTGRMMGAATNPVCG